MLTELRLVCLTHIFRQTDDNFISLLNDVRCGKLSDSSRRLLNALYKPGIDASELEDGFVMLTTHNAKADKVNQDKQDELSTQQQVFTASVKGNFSASAMPAEFELCLKIGAKVMFWQMITRHISIIMEAQESLSLSRRIQYTCVLIAMVLKLKYCATNGSTTSTSIIQPQR